MRRAHQATTTDVLDSVIDRFVAEHGIELVWLETRT